jgi:hypothetical protein
MNSRTRGATVLVRHSNSKISLCQLAEAQKAPLLLKHHAGDRRRVRPGMTIELLGTLLRVQRSAHVSVEYVQEPPARTRFCKVTSSRPPYSRHAGPIVSRYEPELFSSGTDQATVYEQVPDQVRYLMAVMTEGNTNLWADSVLKMGGRRVVSLSVAEDSVHAAVYALLLQVTGDRLCPDLVLLIKSFLLSEHALSHVVDDCGRASELPSSLAGPRWKQHRQWQTSRGWL